MDLIPPTLPTGEITRLKDMSVHLTIGEIRQGERKNLHDIPGIFEKEIYDLLRGNQWKTRLKEAHDFIRSYPLLESGFGFIRGFNGEHYVSNMLEGAKEGMTRLETNNFVYPGFPEQEKGKIDVSPSDKTLESTAMETWRELEVLGFHFHSIIKADGKPSWFNSSPFDMMNGSNKSSFNGLKMRIESGIPAQLLRPVFPLEGDTEEIQYLRKLEPFYGYGMGWGVERKQPLADPNTIEGAYRQYQVIGMSLSEKRAQILLLRDNPLFETKGYSPEPAIFSQAPFDLETRSDACREIIDYYQKQGFDADILFVDLNSEGVTGMKSFIKSDFSL